MIFIGFGVALITLGLLMIMLGSERDWVKKN